MLYRLIYIVFTKNLIILNNYMENPNIHSLQLSFAVKKKKKTNYNLM